MWDRYTLVHSSNEEDGLQNRKMKGKITMLYVTFMLRFSKISLLKENMSRSRNLFLPLASEVERNCWRSRKVFSLTRVWSYKATSPKVCRWQRNWSLSSAFIESGLNVSSRYICDLCKITSPFYCTVQFTASFTYHIQKNHREPIQQPEM